ncbi:hypothetical protein [Pseudodesulfovibrio karagichevae]|uniref:Lipoprotein n=1 Tax=Pseudodesulfovibrio karagichevae TaxID=3239305 RepID=A0ABV4K4R1_9BACT
MKKMRSTLLMAARSLLAGCGIKAVPVGELTGPDVHTREDKSRDGTSVRFNYRLERKSSGAYVIQGDALFQGVGRIRDARMKLCMVRDDEVVATVPLRVRTTKAKKKIYYYNKFKAEKPFDYVTFGWRLKYRY